MTPRAQSERRAPTVAIASRPLWRLRFARELPRRLLYGVATMGLLASARMTVDPPRATLPAALLHRPAPPDLAAEGFATLFARLYLTWEATDPEARENALAAYAGGAIQPGLGATPPSSGEQRVQWAQVVQEREPASGEHVYTVAAQTDTAGLLYLSVSVRDEAAGGGLALAGYPAFVGAPAAGPAQHAEHQPAVSEPALGTVVQRALRNYLAGATGDLAADLAPGAQVSLPSPALELLSLQSLCWAPGGGAVVAVVQASSLNGAQYTLAYELDVARAQGRWEISAIQTEPDEQ
jgi:hypothetical protein